MDNLHWLAPIVLFIAALFIGAIVMKEHLYLLKNEHGFPKCPTCGQIKYPRFSFRR